MSMSLTGVRHSSAVCAKLLGLVAAALSCCAPGFGATCPPQSVTDKAAAARVKELDTAAQSEMRQHKYAEAVRDYREASCLAPNSAPIFYGLGVAEAASGDFHAARKSLRVADRLQPSNVLPLAMLVRVNFSLGDTDSLKAALREASRRFLQDGNLHASLAFLVQNKLFDLALAESLRAQRADGANAESVMELAILENTVGAYEDAIRNAAAVQRQAGLPDAVRAAAAGIAGLSYESTGQREEAIGHLREAIRLDPSQENTGRASKYCATCCCGPPMNRMRICALPTHTARRTVYTMPLCTTSKTVARLGMGSPNCGCALAWVT